MPSFKNIFKVVGQDQPAPPAQSGDIMERIRRDVQNHKVIIYMKGTPDFPQCGFSAAAVEALKDLGVPFESRDVLEDPALRQAIKEYSNWPTIPQVYINGKFVGGADIITEMHANGELAALVK
jgi:monothiol glutaredoxin